MKKFKRALAFLLTLTMLLTMIPLSTFAVGEEKSAVTDEITSEVSLSEKLSTTFAEVKESVQSFFQNFGEKVKIGFAELKEKLTPEPMASEIITSGDFKYQILNNGTASITEYIGSATDLTIPSEIDGHKVTEIREYAFENSNFLTSVTIPDTVMRIEDGAFFLCFSLTNISVNTSNKHYCDIDGVVFSKDKTKIIIYPEGKQEERYVIPNSVTSIENGAFRFCTLANIRIPNSVTSIGDNAFFGSSLKGVVIPNSVTSIGVRAFFWCTSLTSVTISNSVTSIGEGTFALSSLTNVTIPDGVTNIGENAFEDCLFLTSVTIPNSVTSIGSSAFKGCNSLQSVTIPGSVTEIRDKAFGYYYDEDDYKKLSNFAIHGKSGTAAEKYAIENGFTFIDVDSEADFNMSTYIADIWLDPTKVHYEGIHNYMFKFADPCEEVVKLLKSDKGFTSSLKAWEVANIVNKPSEIDNKLLQKKNYYEAVLLSMLATQFKEGKLSGVIDDIAEMNAIEIEKTTNNMYKFYQSIGFVVDPSKKLTESEKSSLKKSLKEKKPEFLKTTFGSIEVVTDIIDLISDINDLNEILGKYATIMSIDSSIKQMLSAMKERCLDVELCFALDDVSFACSSQFGALLTGIRKGVVTLLNREEDALCDMMWGYITKSNVYVACLKAGLAVGISLSNLLCSTDKMIAQFYTMECLSNIRTLLVITSEELGHKYIADPTEMNAKTYISSVDFIYSSYILSSNYMIDYFKIAYEDAFLGKILRSNYESYENLKKTMNEVIKNAEFDYDVLKRFWCYYLEEDYPELFDTMAKAVDLKWYAHLKDAVVRLSPTITYTYTGKQIKPGVTVLLNNQKLKEGEDYTVSYRNNVDVGTATVRVTGCGLYDSYIEKEFYIQSPPLQYRADIRTNLPKTQSPFALYLFNDFFESEEYGIEALNVSVAKNGKEVMKIDNGVIKTSEIQAYIDDDVISIFLPDTSYEIKVGADKDVDISYSYTKYDGSFNATKEKKYNGMIDGSNTVLTQTINNSDDPVFIGGKQVKPAYDSTVANEKYAINITDGASSATSAAKNEWVYISAIVPEGYTFVEWKTSSNIQLADNNSANTSFIMCGSDVTITAVVEKKSDLLGDVNFDGVVNAADAVLIQRYEVGLIELTPEQLEVADTNGDGEVTAADAVLVCRVDAGIISKLVKSVKNKLKEVFSV